MAIIDINLAETDECRLYSVTLLRWFNTSVLFQLMKGEHIHIAVSVGPIGFTLVFSYWELRRSE